MTQILITYDLKKPGQNYDQLHLAIKKASIAWWHYLESTRIIKTDKIPLEVFNLLKPYLDANDHILVVDITGREKEGRLPKEAWHWLNT